MIPLPYEDLMNLIGEMRSTIEAIEAFAATYGPGGVAHIPDNSLVLRLIDVFVAER